MIAGKRSKEGVIMRLKIEDSRKQYNEKTLYNFYSANKIYLACTPSRIMLLEKKDRKSNVKSISLVSRNAVVVNKKTGILLFPDNNR